MLTVALITKLIEVIWPLVFMFQCAGTPAKREGEGSYGGVVADAAYNICHRIVFTLH